MSFEIRYESRSVGLLGTIRTSDSFDGENFFLDFTRGEYTSLVEKKINFVFLMESDFIKFRVDLIFIFNV